MAVASPSVHDGDQCTAAVDLSSRQFYLLQLVGPKQLGVMTSAAGQVFYGVLQNRPTLGQPCDVGIFGVLKVAAGGTIGYGQQLMPNGSGQAIAWTSGNLVVGVALENAVVNQVFSALIVPALN